MSESKSTTEKQRLLNTNHESIDTKPSTENLTKAIDALGFGRAQLIALFIISLSNVGGFSAIQLQPFLSARLYVDLQLSPFSEALLGFVTLGGSMFSSLPVGLISDKIGRKKTNILVCSLITFWNLSTCIAPNFVWIVVCRLMVALSRGRQQMIIPIIFLDLICNLVSVLKSHW